LGADLWNYYRTVILKMEQIQSEALEALCSQQIFRLDVFLILRSHRVIPARVSRRPITISQRSNTVNLSKRIQVQFLNFFDNICTGYVRIRLFFVSLPDVLDYLLSGADQSARSGFRKFRELFMIVVLKKI